jgi:hypothetical protein
MFNRTMFEDFSQTEQGVTAVVHDLDSGASRAASSSDDVSTSMRPAAVGLIISDSTDRPIWLMRSSCTPRE